MTNVWWQLGLTLLWELMMLIAIFQHPWWSLQTTLLILGFLVSMFTLFARVMSLKGTIDLRIRK